ncbi:MAG: 2-oxoglutarate dehydrogenase complex dihydrolipoyllysine-residue succinyltransferase [bacterium]|nr:2-oxoglutarate dehydrogenase complex dihydrolipoyllysine-residue succinyltransferase [bacterium]
MVEIKIPGVGESVTEGFLAEWSKDDGGLVALDEPILVLETDKITMTVNSPAAGRLKIQVTAGEAVEVGQVVGSINTEAADDVVARPETASAETPSADEPTGGAPSPTLTSGQEALLSPAALRLVREHSLSVEQIQGSGRDGRILKEDVLRFLANPPAEQTPPAATSPNESEAPISEAPSSSVRQTRALMSPLRKRLAQRLVEVQQNAALLTTFNEADLSRVMAVRAKLKPVFKERHGVDLGFMSFFVKAAVDALKTVPQVNGFIDDDEMVTNHYYDIGIAVSTEKGLVVPVVRDADKLSMAEIEAKVADLALRARERRLDLDDLTGAIFSISNGGVFGSLLSTPIINPPGSAILGMHTIKKRPVVVDDEIVIRPMMYLAVSYDHRLIDGREAVTFLNRIVECIEDPERMLLEV